MREETVATISQHAGDGAHAYAPAAALCANCGEELRGEFCHGCGERRPDARDLSFGHFARRTFEEATDFEHSKFFNTLGALFLKPGLLTREHFNGRRGRYYSPLKLFVTAFTLSLLLFSLHKATSVYNVEMVVESDPYGNFQRAFDTLARSRNVAPALLAERINERLQKYVNVTQHLPVVMLAFVMVLLYWRQGRYLSEHLVFSLHLSAFLYAFGIILWPLVLWRGIRSPLVLVPTYIVWAVYLYLALRRFYGQSPRKTLVKGAALYVAYIVAMSVYFYAILAAAVINAYRAS